MRKLLGITIGLTFLLIVWGAIVRSHHAGLACPDWPLCHGQVIPPFEKPILLEWGHRLIASLVGLLTLAVTILALASPQYRASLGKIVIPTSVLLLVQAVLGALAVESRLVPAVVTIHLAVAYLFFLLLLWMFLKLPKKGGSDDLPLFQNSERSKRWSRLFGFAFGTTLLVYLQIVLGGLVSSSHAGLACPDFPTCLGEWFPPLEEVSVRYHFFHRVGALGVGVAVGSLVGFGLQSGVGRRFRTLLWGILAFTALQIALGIGNIVFRLPPALSVAHLGVGTALLALLFVLTYRVRDVRLS